MDYSEKFSIIQKELKLSQKDFATKIELTPNAISQYLTGKRKPDINTIQKLIDIGVSPLFLFADAQIPFDETYDKFVEARLKYGDDELTEIIGNYLLSKNISKIIKEKIEKLKGQTLLEKTIDYFTGKSPRMLRVFLEYLQYLNKQNISFSKDSMKNEFIDTLRNFEPSLKFELKYLLTTGEKDKKNLIEWAEQELDDASIYEIMSALPVLITEVEENMTSLDKFINKIVP